MENRRSPDAYVMVALGLTVGGILLGFLSVFADVIGLGANPDMFGRRQLIGTSIGVALCVGGIALLIERPNKRGRASGRQERYEPRLPTPAQTPRRSLSG